MGAMPNSRAREIGKIARKDPMVPSIEANLWIQLSSTQLTVRRAHIVKFSRIEETIVYNTLLRIAFL